MLKFSSTCYTSDIMLICTSHYFNALSSLPHLTFTTCPFYTLKKWKRKQLPNWSTDTGWYLSEFRFKSGTLYSKRIHLATTVNCFVMKEKWKKNCKGRLFYKYYLIADSCSLFRKIVIVWNGVTHLPKKIQHLKI